LSRSDPTVPPPAAVRAARRTLKELAEAANAGLQAGEKSLLAAGQALLEAVGQIEHGRKKLWIKENFQGSYRTAARLMKAAKSATVALLGEVADALQAPLDEDEYYARLDQKATSAGSAKPQPALPFQPTEEPAPANPGEGAESPPAPTGDLPGDACEAPDNLRRDEAGEVIPDHIVEVFDATPALEEVADNLIAIADHLDELKGQPVGVWQDTEGFREQAKILRQRVLDGKPTHVCPHCRGRRCTACNNTGAVPRNIWSA
jgi:hypothetical protein